MQLPFEDRVEAGRLLTNELARRKIDPDAVVLAVTRGGVPVGFEVADRLRLPLDVIVARKVPVPWQPQLTMATIAGSVRVLDEPMIRELEIADEDVEMILACEQDEMRRREEFYRGGRPALDLKGRMALIVDDGLGTGSTMLAAARHARSLKPARVVIGIPVGPEEACNRVRSEADELVCLAVPGQFFAIGEWYRAFPKVRDSEVKNLLAESRRRLESYPARRSAA